MAQMKEWIKAPKLELSDEETANLHIAIESEVKKNIQGMNSEEKETGLKSTTWSRRKK